jgi:hypothetical protein
MKKRILVLTSLVKTEAKAAFEKETRGIILAEDPTSVVCFCHSPATAKQIVQEAKERRATHIMCDGVSVDVGNSAFKLFEKIYPSKYTLLTKQAGIEGGTKMSSYKDIFVKKQVETGVEEESMAAA